MHPTRKKRMTIIVLLVAGISLATGITIWSLQQNMLFFVTPGDVAEQNIPTGRQIRLGGLVEVDSVTRAEDGLKVLFAVTDGEATIPVTFDGILPDLFQEGKGVIARGAFDGDGVFIADEVLAKHDENYMPPEVAEALAEKGHPMGAQGDGN